MQLSRPDLKDKLNRYFFTFGADTAYRDMYVEVWAPDPNEAREVMWATHSSKWSFLYEEYIFEPQIEEYNLECLSVIKPSDSGSMMYLYSGDVPWFDEDSVKQRAEEAKQEALKNAPQKASAPAKPAAQTVQPQANTPVNTNTPEKK